MYSLRINELVGPDGSLLKTTESRDCGVFTHNYQNSDFFGTIKTCQTAENISLTCFDFQVRKDIEILFKGEENRKLLNILFNNGDPASIHVSNKGISIKPLLGKDMLLSNTLLAYALGLKAHRVFKAVTIKADLKKLISEKYCDEQETLERIPDALEGETLETRPLTTGMLEILMKIDLGRSKGLKGRLTMESHTKELLALAYGLTFNDNGHKKQKLTAADMQAVEDAADILHHEFKAPPLQQDLSRRVGLNLNKLSSLFQQVFGVTINTYLLNLRLEKARVMIKNDPDLKVVQLSEEIGFSNPSYFIRKFKEAYGVTPGAYL